MRRCFGRYAYNVMRIFLLALIVAGSFPEALATTFSEHFEHIVLEEADRFGVSVSTDRTADIVVVRFSVSSQFPCQLNAVRVATFENSYPILSALIEPRDGVYQIYTLEAYLEHTRVDFMCVPDGKAPDVFILHLSGLRKDA